MRRFRGTILWGVALAIFSLLTAPGCGDKNTTAPPVNHAPVVASVTVNPGQVAAGGTATVTVLATDPDGDALTYSYQVSQGGISGAGATAIWTAPSTAGAHSVNVTVSDGDKSATGSGMLTVTTAPPPGTGITGTITAPGGINVDLRNMLVRLYSDRDSYNRDAPSLIVTAQGNEFSVSFSFNDLPPGTYYLDAWKDMDASGTYTNGDVWSVYATGAWPNQTVATIVVTAGHVTNCSSGMVTFLL
jgi:hypothetical protein